MNSGVIALVLVLAIAVAVVAVREFTLGARQNRDLAERTALDEVEARSSRLRVRLDVRLRRTKPGLAVAGALNAAGIRTSVFDFSLAVALGEVIVYLLARGIVGSVLGIVVVIGGVYAVRAALRRRAGRRQEEFIAQLPEVARVLSQATEAGLALRRAIGRAAEEVGEPASSELRRVSEALEVGRSVEEALEELARRLPSRELGVLVTTLVIQARAGGTVVSALQNISVTLDNRKDLRREIKTQMAGAVYTGYLVGIMGVLIVLLVNATQPGILAKMVANPFGIAALIIGGSLYVAAFVLMRSSTKIDV